MGQEDKKPADDKPAAAIETENKEAAPKPPQEAPQEIVLKVFMHCEGCARKVRTCLKGFQGVEEVSTDCKTSKVVVKGEKADPLKVLERIQKKSHRRVELISPIPRPPVEDPKKPIQEVQIQNNIDEPPPAITVLLGVYMHCEACAQEIRKRILEMKGVESAVPDLKSSQVLVKGVFESEKLANYIYKRTRKTLTTIKVETEKKEKDKGKEEKKVEEVEKDTKKGDDQEVAKEKEVGGGGGGSGDTPLTKPEGEVEDPKMELRKNEFYYYYPQNHQHLSPQKFVLEGNDCYYPTQMFSDENPNACYVM